ncbi:mitogen-activated protein kinase (MPK13) [Leptomonas pyrrhocoris]|uniref:Mitogen-activated protein kinase (MPK13) n=1 Tax=Leptomonas pyrrhocoris TaxID=157538 RepID=A0A0N0E0M9_LEPPY|nr:mitogen-activated protein kinase (MPK13) [Leptomonas pyrrhocoris]KPA86635.1 mitogen-activated protein kinase (MPK13) [Leptomonas pyrrhocoris]|eukprot:XP_015665074.1 mitogen-activated protein kinase (MPK13) [Leptomonas pyrrhocoris]
MQKYQILGKKGEGTFSEVLRAQDVKTKQFVAIKCMKKAFKSKEQVNRLREIQAVRRLQPHPNIVDLIEVLFDRSTGRLALVLELLDMNLYELIKGRKQYLGEEKVRSYMYQLLKGLDHAHRTGVFHRDIKPENLLLDGEGNLKIADFGSCKGVYSKQPLTEYISTRWYRAPECLLTDGYYTYKMDLWSAGCVFFEMIALFPLFPGTSELDQVHRIHNVLGTPPSEVLDRLKKFGSHMDFDFPNKQGTGLAKLLPHVSPEALDLMQKLLTYDDEHRCTAKEALRHPYFSTLREADKKSRRMHHSISSFPGAVPDGVATLGLSSSPRKNPNNAVPSLNTTLTSNRRLPVIEGVSPVKSTAFHASLQGHPLSGPNAPVSASGENLSLQSLPRI